MPKQKPCQKLIYKLSSSRLKQADWKLTLPLSLAMKNGTDLVALQDSQLLRWICELNGTNNLAEETAKLQKEISLRKRLPESKEQRDAIQRLYEKLYGLQYQKDYLCVVMDSNKDYDRANQGFSVNGYPYHRLLGTNGGIKKSTIVYLGDRIYTEIQKRMDNGRDQTKPIVSFVNWTVGFS